MRTAKTMLALLSFSLLLFSLDASALLVKKPIRSSLVSVTVKVANDPVLPKDFWLGQNYPNPFNSETIIKYDLPKSAIVKLIIYNILGQKVRVLVDEYQNGGGKTIRWDGSNDKGEEVGSGVYFYVLKVGDYISSKKMVLLK